MSSTTQLSHIIDSLISEGKVPSVALVKARLTENIPIPVIIKAIQVWQRTGKVPSVSVQKKASSLEQRVMDLEKEVAQLKRIIQQLSLKNQE